MEYDSGTDIHTIEGREVQSYLYCTCAYIMHPHENFMRWECLQHAVEQCEYRLQNNLSGLALEYYLKVKVYHTKSQLVPLNWWTHLSNCLVEAFSILYLGMANETLNLRY